MLKIPGKAKSHRPASVELVPDLGAVKVQVKLKDGSFRCVSPRVADTHRALMAVSEMNDMGHDVFFPRCDRGNRRMRTTWAAVQSWSSTERTVAHHFEVQQHRSILITLSAGADWEFDGQNREDGEQVVGACRAVSPRNPSQVVRVDRARLV